MEEVNKLIKLCKKHKPFFMFDVAARAAIKIHLYNEREDAKLERRASDQARGRGYQSILRQARGSQQKYPEPRARRHSTEW